MFRMHTFSTAPPDITVPPEDVTVAAPNQAMFTCTAKSFPVSTITWVRINSDGSETNLISGGNLLISSFPAAQMVTSNLTFSTTNLILTAGYVCVATNTMGSDNATAQLIVNGKLHIPVTVLQNYTINARVSFHIEDS